MATLAQIMAGLEARLATITGLRTNDVSPGQISPPCAIIGVPPIDYHLTMGRGKAAFDFTITVFVSATHDRAGQLQLAEYADRTGSKSIVAAVEGDKDLGSTVDDCNVMDFRPLGLDEVGTVGYYGGVFTVRVLAAGI